MNLRGRRDIVGDGEGGRDRDDVDAFIAHK